MLPIPLKNSTGVNLLNPLRIYVSNEYSKVRAVRPWGCLVRPGLPRIAF